MDPLFVQQSESVLFCLCRNLTLPHLRAFQRPTDGYGISTGMEELTLISVHFSIGLQVPQEVRLYFIFILQTWEQGDSGKTKEYDQG